MKITIEFNKAIDFTDKEQLKRLIDRENFNNRLKTAIDNGERLRVKNTFGKSVYKIIIKKNKGE